MNPFSGLNAVVSRSNTTNSLRPSESILPSLATESAFGPTNGTFFGAPAEATSFSWRSIDFCSSAWP